MKKTMIIFVLVIIGFNSCDLTDSDDYKLEPKPWFYNQALEVAYMFGYNLINESAPGLTQNAPNWYVGPNERTGVCVDYSIYFALLTDSYVISSNTDLSMRGIYKIINECAVPGSGYNIQKSGNGIIYRSQDRTEAWYLEKVGDYQSGLGASTELQGDTWNYVDPPNHAWNLTKDNYVVDVTAFDARGDTYIFSYNDFLFSDWFRKITF